jgi:hypothetical protein
VAVDKTGADRQRRYRERRKQDHAALLDQLAALQVRVAQLEVELSARPKPAPTKPSGRQPAADAALRRERDELAERLARIVAFAPGIEAEAADWIKRVDAAPKRRGRRHPKRAD